MPPIKRWYAEATNPERRVGDARPTCIDGMDLFIGLSGARVMPGRGARADEPGRDGLRDGQPDARGLARGGRAATRGSSPPAARTTPTRSTTCSRFPGIFRGALDVRAPPDHRADEDGRRPRRSPTIVPDDELREDYIIPSVFNRDVAPGRRRRRGRGARAPAAPPRPATSDRLRRGRLAGAAAGGRAGRRGRRGLAARRVRAGRGGSRPAGSRGQAP